VPYLRNAAVMKNQSQLEARTRNWNCRRRHQKASPSMYETRTEQINERLRDCRLPGSKRTRQQDHSRAANGSQPSCAAEAYLPGEPRKWAAHRFGPALGAGVVGITNAGLAGVRKYFTRVLLLPSFGMAGRPARIVLHGR
jgi:hypothetical protein